METLTPKNTFTLPFGRETVTFTLPNGMDGVAVEKALLTERDEDSV